MHNVHFGTLCNKGLIISCQCFLLTILKISMWVYNLMVNNIVRSKYVFVKNNKIQILFSNYILGLTFKSNLYLQETR